MIRGSRLSFASRTATSPPARIPPSQSRPVNGARFSIRTICLRTTRSPASHSKSKIIRTAGLIYSDEDKIDENGVRSNPFFKPDWNPELFLGQNFINHLGAYLTELLREIRGFREGFEGSQDYDLALRCVDRLKPEQIRHIPRILYHWRAVAGSLAAVPDAKPYAKEAARRAIGDHLQRQGIAGRVEPCPENVESHRVVYELPDRRRWSQSSFPSATGSVSSSVVWKPFASEPIIGRSRS